MNGTSQILVEDPELAEHLHPQRRPAAARECVAWTIAVPAGPWDPPRELSPLSIRLLLLDGLIVRRVGVAGRFGAELLGAGDLLRPSQTEDTGVALPRSGGWRVLTPARVAILDREFAAILGRYPELIPAVLSRAIRRARHLAVTMAIVHQPRVDVRLHMLFWDLAGRWGRVRADGVHVPLALTRPVLADLVAAQRETVSRALGELAERGLVLETGDGWLLSGDPPSELSAVGAIAAA